GNAAGHALFAVGIAVREVPLLVAGRILSGACGGMAVPQAAIADVTPPRDRTKNFGLLGGAVGVGFVVGPLAGQLLSSPDLVPWFTASTPFAFAAAIGGGTALLVRVLMPDGGSRRERRAPLRLTHSVHNISRAFAVPQLRGIFLVSFLL